MDNSVRAKRQAGPGAPVKSGSEARTHVRQSSFNDEELERLQWAAKEVGLPIAVFMRMATLKFSKEILG